MQYTPFDDKTEVRGSAVLSVVEAISVGKEQRRRIIEKHGIHNPSDYSWHAQRDWLSAMGEISESNGAEHLLFAIGKAIPTTAIRMPKGISLRAALSGLQRNYESNHRGGEIGYYKILEINVDKRHAVFECRNPYPSEFDHGLLTSLARIAEPSARVERSDSQPSRRDGGRSCFFNISW